MMKLFWFSFGNFLLVACSNSSAPNAKASDTLRQVSVQTYPVKPVVFQKDDGDQGGWGADFGLSIVAVSENDSATTYKAISSWENQNVGLSVTIPNKETKSGFGKGVQIRSLGIESDRLIRMMAKLYNQKIDSAAHFKDSTSVEFVNLGTFAKDVAGKAADSSAKKEYKLFFTLKDDVAELYLNIDDHQHRLEIQEKDPDYRLSIILSLRK